MMVDYEAHESDRLKHVNLISSSWPQPHWGHKLRLQHFAHVMLRAAKRFGEKIKPDSVCLSGYLYSNGKRNLSASFARAEINNQSILHHHSLCLNEYKIVLNVTVLFWKKIYILFFNFVEDLIWRIVIFLFWRGFNLVNFAKIAIIPY